MGFLSAVSHAVFMAKRNKNNFTKSERFMNVLNCGLDTLIFPVIDDFLLLSTPSLVVFTFVRYGMSHFQCLGD